MGEKTRDEYDRRKRESYLDYDEKKDYIESFNYERYGSSVLRHDPILVQLFEELGPEEFEGLKKRKNGTYERKSDIRVKLIDAKYVDYYEIECYDGAERIDIDYSSYKLDQLKANYKTLLDAVQSSLEVIDGSLSSAKKIVSIKKFLSEALPEEGGEGGGEGEDEEDDDEVDESEGEGS